MNEQRRGETKNPLRERYSFDLKVHGIVQLGGTGRWNVRTTS